MEAKKYIILPIFLGIVLASGCTSFNLENIAETTPIAQEFMEEHPNAEIIITKFTKEEVAEFIEDIRTDCDNPYINVDDYYRATVKDPETNLKLIIWANIDEIKCIMKSDDKTQKRDILNATCPDGTPHGQCSSFKPKYCDNGELIDKCQDCGCHRNQKCRVDGKCEGGKTKITQNEKEKWSYYDNRPTDPDSYDDKSMVSPIITEPDTKPSQLSSRWTNPTAPNDLIKYLSGNFTDTDGDGMTDLAEIKYGFDPKDYKSFPGEPEFVEIEKIEIENSGINAYFEVGCEDIIIKWSNPTDSSYSLSLKTLGSEEWNIYYGGHYSEYAPVYFSKFGLTGKEIIKGRFTEYAKDNSLVEEYPEFTIDLSSIEFPKVGESSNKISYTFSENFPEDAETKYRDFLKRVFPIMYLYLGPPAESFNILIRNTGEDSSYFMVVDNGRTFLTDTDFVPRLITHEFVHAWKGKYTITSDENWEYSEALTGFEEATAEGMAFEIMHEYVRSYPNHSATIKLLSWKPYQYWSSRTTYYDSIKNNRWTGAGDFWTHSGGQKSRYSIAATTIQMMVRENPNFMKDFLAAYYKKIRENTDWRSNRDDIINMWETLVPELNGQPLRSYLNTLPVFNGKKLDEGIYVLNTIRPYGINGDQQFAVGYAIHDGRLWWGVGENDLDAIPEWIRTSQGEDGYYYTDMQSSDFKVEIVDMSGSEYPTYHFETPWDRDSDGSPTGLGWYRAEELAMEKFPIGLYKETVTFTDYIDHDDGARDTFYFFGIKDFEQNIENDYVIMIGIDGVTEGLAKIRIGGKEYSSEINNGVAIFKSTDWKYDIQGKFLITITNNKSISRNYYRTIIESGTFHGYYQQQFIIIDKDFDGNEDMFKTTAEKCTDSDDGKNYFESGTAYGRHQRGHGPEIREWNDYCIDSNRLIEYSCRTLTYPDSDPLDVWSDSYDCPNGCEYGTCIEEENGDKLEITPACTDTDSVDDKNVRGKVYGVDSDGSDYEIWDSCSEDKLQVLEKWCYDNPDGQGKLHGTKLVDCDNECKDGICTEEENGNCPSGWTKINTEGTDMCWKSFYPQDADYNGAVQICNSHDATLPTIQQAASVCDEFHLRSEYSATGWTASPSNSGHYLWYDKDFDTNEYSIDCSEQPNIEHYACSENGNKRWFACLKNI